MHVYTSYANNKQIQTILCIHEIEKSPSSSERHVNGMDMKLTIKKEAMNLLFEIFEFASFKNIHTD